MSFTQVEILPFSYMNGLVISNNATTPNTKFDISAGKCKDSTDTFDIISGETITVDATASGINGLDTGTFAASKVYNVFIVGSPISGQVTCAMMSLSAIPLLPFGYNVYKLIGYIVSNASTQFLPAYWFGDRNNRKMIFDAPQATAVTAGNATSYTGVALTTLVPAVSNTPVYVASAFTPGAASRTLNMQSFGATGDAVTITGQVTSVVVSTNSMVLSRLNSAAPTINYKVANSGDAVALRVAGFEFVV